MPDYAGAGFEPWTSSEEYKDAVRELRQVTRQVRTVEGRLRGENVRRNKNRKKKLPTVREEKPESV